MKFNVDDLIEKGLVKKKTYTEGKYKGLSVLKYSKKVFWGNLWHLDERLLECRGIVVDENDNVIVMPFKKVFNLGEGGTKVDSEREVVIVEKVNGFMGAATMTDKYGLIISTTGSLDSEFSSLARKWIGKGNTNRMFVGRTYLFEICDKTDPHIVEEEEGAYLIGQRLIRDGLLGREQDADLEAKFLNYKRPSWKIRKFKDLPATKKEGFMIRCGATQEVLCKVKSKHYLSKKLIMRLGKAKVDLMFDNPKEFKKWIKDEEFYEFVDYMAENIDKEVWRSYNDQKRREFTERYYAGE